MLPSVTRTHHAEHVARGGAPLGTVVEHAIEADFESRTGGLSKTLDGSVSTATHETYRVKNEEEEEPPRYRTAQLCIVRSFHFLCTPVPPM